MPVASQIYELASCLEMAVKGYGNVIKLNANDFIAHPNLDCALAEQSEVESAV